ncbi:hypothetical protein DFH11DRAFT_1844125 [Phellopilus nigrolimitatus]|nr:hypothetical protein DFH11DRAFT_1844125 [Phellopilus nigrolimitatus]
MHSIRSDVEPVDPSLVPLFISEIDITRYTGVAILTLLVYDTIITMDKEVDTAWHYCLHSSPRSFVSLIYFANRYIGILGAISVIVHLILQVNETLGLGFDWIESLANWMNILFIDYILLMRVLALYHQDKRLAACLRILFGLEAAFGLGLLIYPNIYEEIVVWDFAKDVTVCADNRNPPKVWTALSWAAPMVYAIILMVLALYKAAEHWRETAGFSRFSLVKVLIQDQAIYFLIGLGANYSDRVICCCVVEIMAIQLYIPNVLLSNILNILGHPSLLCVLGSHLLVHLKEAGERGTNGGTSYRMKTISSIGFS